MKKKCSSGLIPLPWGADTRFPGAKGKPGAAWRVRLQGGCNAWRRWLPCPQVPALAWMEPRCQGGFQLAGSRQGRRFALLQSQLLLRAATRFRWKMQQGLLSLQGNPALTPQHVPEGDQGLKPCPGEFEHHYRTSGTAEPGW